MPVRALSTHPCDVSAPPAIFLTPQTPNSLRPPKLPFRLAATLTSLIFIHPKPFRTALTHPCIIQALSAVERTLEAPILPNVQKLPLGGAGCLTQACGRQPLRFVALVANPSHIGASHTTGSAVLASVGLCVPELPRLLLAPPANNFRD